MKSLNPQACIFIFILLLALAACGQPAATPAASGDVVMSVRVEPEPPAVGQATLIVALKNASGAPLDGAKIRVHGDMDHQGMMPVDGEANESANGEYRVPFEWTMGGGWIVTVTAQMPSGSEISERFDFFVEAVSRESIIRHATPTPGGASGG